MPTQDDHKNCVVFSDFQGDMEAFEREYQADHSWEKLTEDEEGRLLPVVCELLDVSCSPLVVSLVLLMKADSSADGPSG